MNKTIITTLILILIKTAFGQSPGDNLFDDSYLHEIRFEMADTNFFITTKNYQQLKMIVDGNTLDSVGFKRKGNISYYTKPNKYAIKVKTNKYISGKKYDGIKEFTLHMNFQDPSMMREKLTYDICADMGLFSLRSAFAKVYVNNDYWGLYTLVEGKDEMYKHIFDNRDMDAIESLDFGDMCYISNNPSDYDEANNGGNPTYQLENGNPLTAWPRFATMIDKANNTPNSQYIDTMSKYLNLEDFFIYQAINVYLMNFDSYIGFKGNQIYVYDTTVNLWQVTPWDFNASFGLWNTNNFIPSTYPIIPSVISNGCIAKKMNNIPILKTYYLDAMCNLNNIIGDTTTYFAKIDMWKAQIQQAVYDDTRKHITNIDFDNAINYGFHMLFGDNQPALKTFISQRLSVVKQGLANENYNCQVVGINDVYGNILLNIYPNPASHHLNFDTKEENNNVTNLSIINRMGQIVQTTEDFDHNQIDIRNLKAGLYFIVLKDKTGKKLIGKFVKK